MVCFPDFEDSRSSIRIWLTSASFMYNCVVISGVPEAMLYSTDAIISYMRLLVSRMLSLMPTALTKDTFEEAPQNSTEEVAGLTEPVALALYSSANGIITLAVPIEVVACGFATNNSGIDVAPEFAT